MENKQFQKEVMLYLKNIVNKCINLSEKVCELGKKIVNLENVMMQGFRATGIAFNQMKTVTAACCEEARGAREDLAEYGGVIENSTFDTYMKTRIV